MSSFEISILQWHDYMNSVGVCFKKCVINFVKYLQNTYMQLDHAKVYTLM